MWKILCWRAVRWYIFSGDLLVARANKKVLVIMGVELTLSKDGGVHSLLNKSVRFVSP